MSTSTRIPTPSPNRLEVERRATKHRSIALGAAAFVAAVWGLWPMGPIIAPRVPNTSPVSPPSTDEGTQVVLDASVFDAPLWNPPPPPPAPPSPPQPKAPWRLQLVAILRDTDAQGRARARAAVYDPDKDVTSILLEQETVAGRRIERIGSGWVELSDGSDKRRLVLDDQPPASVTPAPGRATSAALPPSSSAPSSPPSSPSPSPSPPVSPSSPPTAPKAPLR